MKQKIAALIAALMMLSACSAQKPSAAEKTVSAENTQTNSSSASREQMPVEADTESEAVPSTEIETKPIELEVHFSDNFTDEPYAFQTDVEEIVSVSLTLPAFSLDSAEAAKKINAVFETLRPKLQDYAGTTVYETAQTRNTIGFIEGSYSAGLENGILTVTYTVTERYADDDGFTTHENVYQFDAATGERLDA